MALKGLGKPLNVFRVVKLPQCLVEEVLRPLRTAGPSSLFSRRHAPDLNSIFVNEIHYKLQETYFMKYKLF